MKYLLIFKTLLIEDVEREEDSIQCARLDVFFSIFQYSSIYASPVSSLAMKTQYNVLI